MNLQGSIDLLKLEKAGIATIKNKKCIVIPIEENDLYVSMDENLKAKSVYLGLNINERREPVREDALLQAVFIKAIQGCEQDGGGNQVKGLPWRLQAL